MYTLLFLTSGVAATRFSSGKCSLGTPTVSLEYGIPLGVSSSLVAAEKNLCAADDEDESCLCRMRSPSDRTLPGLMEARRIMMMMTPFFFCFYFLSFNCLQSSNGLVAISFLPALKWNKCHHCRTQIFDILDIFSF